jgi:hypothetical protein
VHQDTKVKISHHVEFGHEGGSQDAINMSIPPCNLGELLQFSSDIFFCVVAEDRNGKIVTCV